MYIPSCVTPLCVINTVLQLSLLGSLQGVEGWDVDLPTGIEANAIVHTAAKIGWMIVYILVYGIRPLIIRPKPVGLADVINWGLVLTFDGALLYSLGFKSLLYLLLGTVFGGGLHPIAGHLIQEHYMFVTVSERLDQAAHFNEHHPSGKAA